MILSSTDIGGWTYQSRQATGKILWPVEM
jgi:hypothetical protein